MEKKKKENMHRNFSKHSRSSVLIVSPKMAERHSLWWSFGLSWRTIAWHRSLLSPKQWQWCLEHRDHTDRQRKCGLCGRKCWRLCCVIPKDVLIRFPLWQLTSGILCNQHNPSWPQPLILKDISTQFMPLPLKPTRAEWYSWEVSL